MKPFTEKGKGVGKDEPCDRDRPMRMGWVCRLVLWMLVLPACVRVPDADSAASEGTSDVVVIVSAGSEWRELLTQLHEAHATSAPYGDWFVRGYKVGREQKPVVFLHGGWGKVSAAGSAQYAIDRWKPQLLIVLGTCGGFEGVSQKGDILLASRTLIYDVIERMGDPEEALAAYATHLDVGIVPASVRAQVKEQLLISADQDIDPAQVAQLKSRFKAIAADWESGAIAYVAARNHTPVILLKGVSDIVGATGGEAYGKVENFDAGTRLVMGKLLALLPRILEETPVLRR